VKKEIANCIEIYVVLLKTAAFDSLEFHVKWPNKSTNLQISGVLYMIELCDISADFSSIAVIS